jgi:hypothetical protein
MSTRKASERPEVEVQALPRAGWVVTETLPVALARR